MKMSRIGSKAVNAAMEIHEATTAGMTDTEKQFVEVAGEAFFNLQMGFMEKGVNLGLDGHRLMHLLNAAMAGNLAMSNKLSEEWAKRGFK